MLGVICQFRCESEFTILLLWEAEERISRIYFSWTVDTGHASLTISDSLSGGKYSWKTIFNMELLELTLVYSKKIAKMFRLWLKLHDFWKKSPIFGGKPISVFTLFFVHLVPIPISMISNRSSSNHHYQFPGAVILHSFIAITALTVAYEFFTCDYRDDFSLFLKTKIHRMQCGNYDMMKTYFFCMCRMCRMWMHDELERTF